MRIVIDNEIFIQKYMDIDDQLVEDFKKCSIFFKNGFILEQKIDLSEEEMNDYFLSPLYDMGFAINLRMYNVGRYKLEIE